MTPYYRDNHIRIFNKDCRQMTELADNSVQCVCTSPPYWGLRRYSGEQELIWGGDEKCEHKWGTQLKDNRHDHTWATSSPIENRPQTQYVEVAKGQYCGTCGAWKGAYGLEPTPEMYVQHTIEILREIRRVLRKDGVVFWNIGDSYNSAQSGYGEWTGEKARQGDGEFKKKGMTRTGVKHKTIKPKDMCLIPFRVAIAAQEDGWWVRSIIIWSKPNPMPQSMKDRPTVSHEYIIMLTKSARYYYDADAVRESGITGDMRRPYTSKGAWEIDGRPENQRHGGELRETPAAGRNLRSVWTFPTVPFPNVKIGGRKLDHFAVFPEKLPELCIKAGTPEVGCCAECGAPWVRVLETKPSQFNIRVRDAKAGRATPEEGYKATPEEVERYPGNHPDPGYSKTIGWRPTCKCNAPRVPSLVLDPMAGAGTTLWVAKKLNRYAVGYELSQEYSQLAVERCRQQVLG